MRRVQRIPGYLVFLEVDWAPYTERYFPSATRAGVRELLLSAGEAASKNIAADAESLPWVSLRFERAQSVADRQGEFFFSGFSAGRRGRGASALELWTVFARLASGGSPGGGWHPETWLDGLPDDLNF